MSALSMDASQDLRGLLELLRNADPDILMAMFQPAVIEAFQRAAQRVPAYKARLQQTGVDPTQVTTLDAFRRLAPVLDKQNTFVDCDIADLCLDGNLDDVISVISSSGHSGVFSFGVSTMANLQATAQGLDAAMDYFFEVSQRKTLLINCYSVGLRIYTDLVTVANTGVRPDAAVGIVQKFAKHYDQIILLGDGVVVKHTIEEGEERGVDWKSLPLHVLTGGDGIAENWRTYIAQRAGINLDDPSTGTILSTMGVAELDLNIFHETLATVGIRRLAHADRRLRYALFGEGVEVCPMFFVYYPHRVFLETHPADAPRGELVISMLSPDLRIPLLRYNTKDMARMFTYRQVGETLRQSGYENAPLPELRLPMVAVYGRGRGVEVSGRKVFPEEVREALYADGEVASAVTGNCKLRAAENSLHVQVQLKPNVEPSPVLDAKLKGALAQYVPTAAIVQFHRYSDFPYSMTVDYERKFSYLD